MIASRHFSILFMKCKTKVIWNIFYDYSYSPSILHMIYLKPYNAIMFRKIPNSSRKDDVLELSCVMQFLKYCSFKVSSQGHMI